MKRPVLGVDEQPVETGCGHHSRDFDGRQTVLDDAQGNASVGKNLARSIVSHRRLELTSIAELGRMSLQSASRGRSIEAALVEPGC